MLDFLIKKALTLRASSLGDCLMGKYFLENVHAQFPDAKCVLLVGSRAAMIRDLFAGYKWLEVLEVNRKNPQGVFQAWKRLHPVDLTLTQYAERPFSLPSKLFGRAVTRRGGFIGFNDHSRLSPLLYDKIIPFNGEIESQGMIVEEQRALETAGLAVALPQLTLQYVQKLEVFSRFGLKPGQYVLAHLFSGAEGRSFSQEKRIAIVEVIRATLPADIKLVLTGGPGDRLHAEETKGDLRGVINLAGDTSIQELINLIKGSKGVVALDTGAAHITAHLGVPLVIMTRTEALNGWWGVSMYNNIPMVLCNKNGDDKAPRESIYPPSLETIDLSQIIDKVAELL